MLRHISRTHDYGICGVWISAHVGLCMSVCAAMHAHACLPRTPPCMIASEHAFAALREEQHTSGG